MTPHRLLEYRLVAIWHRERSVGHDPIADILAWAIPRCVKASGAGMAMYFKVISQCIESLRNVELWLDKAEQYAAAKKFDVGVLLTSRLAPDMQGLVYQVQSACDYVKAGAGWLSGEAPPKHADNEQGIEELRSRIRKTLAFAEAVAEEQFVGASERKIGLPWAPGKALEGEDYLLQIIIPNVYFHLAMIYAILRHNGVEIGKMDFLGNIRWMRSLKRTLDADNVLNPGKIFTLD